MENRVFKNLELFSFISSISKLNIEQNILKFLTNIKQSNKENQEISGQEHSILQNDYNNLSELSKEIYKTPVIQNKIV